jgi:hypothetical protein
MGKVDGGVFTHWLSPHFFGRALDYIGESADEGMQPQDPCTLST